MESALAAMAQYFGYQDFKPGQREIIDGILDSRDVIGVMPTGGGKSLCYQLPGLVLSGITLVISPLIALMKDQVDALNNQGVPASFINSSLNLSEIQARLKLAYNGEVKLLYIAPERLDSKDFTRLLYNLPISLIAIDEAHCVSQWGHDFRPSYLNIRSWIEAMKNRPVVAAFTATATTRVRQDIIENLGLKQPKTIINSFNRPNLYFAVNKGVDRIRYISNYIDKHPNQSGIIYAATRKEVENIFEQLLTKNYSVAKYHAGLKTEERTKNQEDFLHDRIKVMIATNAFGMGIDKSNISFVIHHNMPRHLEAYYQEAGRAGRDGQPAECILLYHPSDIQIQKYFIENANLAEKRKISEYEKLKNIIDYCHSPRCLRENILKYFGELSTSDNCDNCANCKEQEIVDITIEAQKIFSCIIRMREQYGSKIIAAVLKGSQQKRVFELGFEKLSTYGIMNNLTMPQITEYINILAAEDFLTITNGQYPVVKMKSKALPVLRGQEKILIRRPKATETTVYENELFEALRNLRQEIAQQQGVPPYVIFADKTLWEMCEYLPLNVEAMLCINGVGQVKFERYGEKFLEIIKNYTEANLQGSIENSQNNDTSIESTNSKTKKKTKESKTPTHVLSWQMYQEGKSLSDISKVRELKITTIEEHIIKAVQNGYSVEWYDFITPETEAKVLEKVNTIGVEKLKPIKESLPDKISYFDIKIALLKNELKK
ncbi:ATP-dependent DNA helicase RecQ [Candidatus Syntrophocurvum alkaliphilum]|uniref:DNA helicase RecQ n=1 Tax=Candidatus Syntrophocurvum alkaliphilum TaxID=2293317 RepID=A0A6I6DPC7_9FIRM|nr:DNA helicase RecQ [Candidatus Syntrophocurvum alkaliphilum]QGU00831.1 ATP-dependent DNA helicase RecQ [Candidatus Syntrophocurvum alkaliphilum]